MKNGITRRGFLKSSAFLGGSAWFVSKVKALEKVPGLTLPRYSYVIQKAKNIIHSTCLQCHTACPITAKFFNDILAKIDGNPYSPQNRLPHIPYGTPEREGARQDGKLCPKGQAGIQTLYDPYRVVRVLKRNGPRGSGRWKTISFDQAITEIVEGGQLFRDIGESRRVEGLKDIFALRDPKVAKQMAEDVAAIRKKKMTVADFKKKHAANLGVLIDPDHPDIGPKNNQFVFMAGRIEHGRKEFGKRFTHDSFGSVNFFEHTTICEQSHHIAYNEMTRAWKGGKWGKGKHHMKPDILNAEFVIFWGTGAFEANFGPTNMSEKVTRSLRERNFRYAVVDPRLSHTAAKADYWLPVKPGGDGALALAMIRWIIKNERYDAKYLENANKAAAAAEGEPTWTNASHLVRIEKDGSPSKLLRAAEVGLGPEDRFVVSRKGTLVAVDPNDAKNAVEGDLLAEGEQSGVRFKSAFQLLKESALSRSIDKYSRLSGIEKDQIAQLADEFTSHGKKAGVDLYRGAVQHTNGYYNAQAIITLNLLVGNPDWKGGLSAGGGHWHESGGKPGSRYTMKKLHPGKLASFGVTISREKATYEESTLFSGYPAKRPWYPLSSNVYQEIIPSARDAYPYPVKALLLHMGTPIMSVPGGDKLISVLRDTKKIPLFIADDIVIGETSMYADYIFPDVTYLERWGTPHISPDVLTKVSKVRQPAARPLSEEVNVGGYRMPSSMEAILIAVAKRLKLSGFGNDAFAPGMGLDRPEDFYLKLVTNIAFGDKKGDVVPDADGEGLDTFQKARRFLPRGVFDLEHWKKAVADGEFNKVVYVLNRGGRYEAADKAYKGKYLAHQFKKMFSVYCEKTAGKKNSMTGKNFSGTPIYEPIMNARGNPVKDRGYPFTLITFKEISGGHSRTIPNYWSQVSLLPENEVWVSRRDAARLGLGERDTVRLTSRSNPRGEIDLGNGDKIKLEARVRLVEGIKPGVVAIAWHYGHWAYGSGDVVVDGSAIRGDGRRRKGIVPNPLMRIDETTRCCLTDPIGASSSFYDTKVKLVKA